MRVLYQPTQQNPGDWLSVDAAAWGGLAPFTCHALCVQGVVFDGADHYAVERLPNGNVEVTVWYDDPADWPPGTRWARVTTLRPLAPDLDPRMGGALNTRQTHVIYAEAGIAPAFNHFRTSADYQLLPWNAFDARSRPGLGSGQWVSDAHHAAHQAQQSIHGWREWSDHLPAIEKDARGHLLPQRGQGRYEVPKGTRTYYHNNVALANGAVAATNENELGTAPAGASSQNSGNVNTAGSLQWAATTPGGQPDSAAWPTTGVYRYQIDCTAAGVDLAFGLLSLGSTGYFGRVDSGLTTLLGSFPQAEAAFSGSGLKLATVTNPAWAAGSATDRFMVAVAAQKIVGHGTQTMTLELGETDDFADGPWAAAAAARRTLIT